MSGEASEQGVPNRRGRRTLPWRRDGAILARLRIVERRHLAGETNVAIASGLGVDEATVRNDLKRLAELWLEQTQLDQAALRALVLAKLEDVRVRALAAAEWDQLCERAVLFNDLPETDDPEPDGDVGAADIRAAQRPRRRTVYRDEKGSAQFRGNKAGALQAARAATMDQAKILGITVDRYEHSGPDGGPLVLNARTTDLTDDELDRRLAELDERASALLAGGQAAAPDGPGGAGEALPGAREAAP